MQGLFVLSKTKNEKDSKQTHSLPSCTLTLASKLPSILSPTDSQQQHSWVQLQVDPALGYPGLQTSWRCNNVSGWVTSWQCILCSAFALCGNLEQKLPPTVKLCKGVFTGGYFRGPHLCLVWFVFTLQFKQTQKPGVKWPLTKKGGKKHKEEENQADLLARTENRNHFLFLVHWIVRLRTETPAVQADQSLLVWSAPDSEWTFNMDQPATVWMCPNSTESHKQYSQSSFIVNLLSFPVYFIFTWFLFPSLVSMVQCCFTGLTSDQWSWPCWGAESYFNAFSVVKVLISGQF